MAATGANPLLTVAQNLPEHIRELEAEQGKLVTRLQEIGKELTAARLHLLVALEGVPEKVEEPRASRKGAEV